jgi:hypothetical protein
MRRHRPVDDTQRASVAVGPRQSIFVTGESPLVDVQTVRGQFVVTREMMDNLPSHHLLRARL